MIKFIARKVVTSVFMLVMCFLIVCMFGAGGAFITTLIEGPHSEAHLSLPVIVGLVMGALTCVALAIDLDWLDLFSGRKGS